MKSTPTTTFELRPGQDRGVTRFDWLASRHSFSFGHYQDPERMHYRSLRVINDDVIAPGGGFGTHPHRDMEIISWMLDGGLAHRDSTGMDGVITPGDVQVMSAGTGITHSELNASATESAHLIQIWIQPRDAGLDPSYEQRHFSAEGRRNQWQLLVSGDAADGGLVIQQDAVLRVAELESGQDLPFATHASRHGYLHITRGAIVVDGTALHAGDAITWSGDQAFTASATEDAQLLFFDLA